MYAHLYLCINFKEVVNMKMSQVNGSFQISLNEHRKNTITSQNSDFYCLLVL